jgi:hypothetical protein
MIGVRHGGSPSSLGSRWYDTSAHVLKTRSCAGPIPGAVGLSHTVDQAHPATGHAARRAATGGRP